MHHDGMVLKRICVEGESSLKSEFREMERSRATSSAALSLTAKLMEEKKEAERESRITG